MNNKLNQLITQFSIIEDLIKSNVVGLIVIDSVAALVPEAELKGEISDNTIALQARLMSKALRRLTNMINKNNIIIIFINQLREKVGVIFGNPEITPGGRSLKFYASQRIEIRKSQNITVKGEITGITVKAKVVKNKINVPFKKAVIEILFNGGISINNEYINIAIENNIILQNGSWYSYKNKKIGPGKERLYLWAKDNSAEMKEIEKAIKKLKL